MNTKTFFQMVGATVAAMFVLNQFGVTIPMVRRILRPKGGLTTVSTGTDNNVVSSVFDAGADFVDFT